jgi:GNAT superfamily N-acetyltransferase
VSFDIQEVSDLDAEFPTLTLMMEELHQYHIPFWPREFLPDWPEKWRRFISGPEARLVLIAREGGEPAGLMMAVERRDPALFAETFVHLEDAYVREPYRRSGLGSAMLRRVEAWSQHRGVPEVRLGVVAANQLGVDFWTKSGFRPLTHLMTKSVGVAS